MRRFRVLLKELSQVMAHVASNIDQQWAVRLGTVDQILIRIQIQHTRLVGHNATHHIIKGLTFPWMGVIILKQSFLAPFGVLKNGIGRAGWVFVFIAGKVFRQLMETRNGGIVSKRHILSVVVAEGNIHRVSETLRVVNPCTKDRLQQGNTERSLLVCPGGHLLEYIGRGEMA